MDIHQSHRYARAPATRFFLKEEISQIIPLLISPMLFTVTSSAPATIRTTLTSTTTTSSSIRQTGISITKAPSMTFTVKAHPNCQTKVPLSENLKEFANHCYEFILGVHKMWPDAELDCNQRGGHLTSIGNLSEQNFIYHSLRVGINQTSEQASGGRATGTFYSVWTYRLLCLQTKQVKIR